jgi:hypothetical protein
VIYFQKSQFDISLTAKVLTRHLRSPPPPPLSVLEWVLSKKGVVKTELDEDPREELAKAASTVFKGTLGSQPGLAKNTAGQYLRR